MAVTKSPFTATSGACLRLHLHPDQDLGAETVITCEELVLNTPEGGKAGENEATIAVSEEKPLFMKGRLGKMEK